MSKSRYSSTRLRPKILLRLLFVFIILSTLYYLVQQKQVFNLSKADTISNHLAPDYIPPEPIQTTHILGGFSANSVAEIANVSSDGIQTIFYYGVPPAVDSPLGRDLQSRNMHIIDGFISSSLYYFECQRLKALLFPPDGLEAYCGQNDHPTFGSEDAFLAAIATHLKMAAHNRLIIAYWVLDDWIESDAGSAKGLLIKIHQLIQQYTPGRAAICGFGGSILPRPGLGWYDWLADNFTPGGCDAVGLYAYSASQSDALPLNSSETYDWSMSRLLPAMFTSLKRRGWNIKKEPLIGIAQAFGGPIADKNSQRVTPSALDIEEQSLSFCKYGAIGLSFYGWEDSSFDFLSDTPMNNNNIEAGIRNGISACKFYWKNTK